MYCVVSTPTGPRPLSAARMVTWGFSLISLRSFCWRGVRFGVTVFRVNRLEKASVKWLIRESISRGGRGARHDDFIRRVLGSYVSSGLLAKKVRRPISRSRRDVVCSIELGVIFIRGVGTNLSPRPRSWSAVGGSLCVEVRS